MTFFKIISLTLILWIFGFIWFIVTTESTNNDLEYNTAHTIVVFTGAKGRIDAGLQLLEKEKAKELFISGVGRRTALNHLTKYLSNFEPTKLEKLKPFIYLGHFANSTEGNATETKAWLKKYNRTSIILVTSNYHMPRSLILLKSVMPNIKITPYNVIRKDKSWNSIAVLKLVFLEYNKLLFTLPKMVLKK